MTTKTKKPSPDELLALIAAKAPELRKAGVKAVTLDGDGFRVELAPHVDETPAPSTKANGDVVEPADPWNDPSTYGLPPGAKVPGFDRPKKEPE
jgi:hypothetical protein